MSNKWLYLPIQFEAVIPAVGNHNVTFLGNGHSLRTVQRAPQGIDEGQERALRVKDLKSRVAPVRHHDVVLLVHGHAGGSIELAVTLAIGAEAEQELTVAIEDLQEQIVR